MQFLKGIALYYSNVTKPLNDWDDNLDNELKCVAGGLNAPSLEICWI